MKIISALLLVLLIAVPAQAMNGYIETEFDFDNNMVATLNLNDALTKDFSVGFTAETYLENLGLFEAQPISQSYLGYIELKLSDSLSTKFSMFSTHWFNEANKSDNGMAVSARYSF